MSKPVSVPNAFQTQNGPIPLAQLDADFTALAAALNDVATYGTLLIDSSGVANTITVTTPVNVTFSYSLGVLFQVQIANTTTSTAPTINVNGLGAKALVNSDGSLPVVGQFVSGQILEMQYDGIAMRVLGSPGASAGSLAKLSLGQPASGPALTITNLAGQDAVDVNINQTAGVGWALNISGASAGDLRGILIGNTTSGATAGTAALYIANSGGFTFDFGKTSPGFTGSKFTGAPAGEICWMQSGGLIPISVVINTTEAMRIANTGVTVDAPQTSGIALTVNAAAGNPALNVLGVNSQFAQEIAGGAGVGTSFGLTISAGTNASDVSAVILNATGTTIYLKIFGDGGVTVGNPTGGSKGPGTINVANGLYLNGVLYTSP